MTFLYANYKIEISNCKYSYLQLGYIEDTIYEISFVLKEHIEKKNTTFTDYVYKQIKEYLDGNRKVFDFSYTLRGTPFQQSVYKSLLTIPYGETRSYKEIATLIDSPKAVRAVGNANNKNSLPILVPCHRVIGADGSLTGYAYGVEMKQCLLHLERNEFSC
ncbi:MAG: methylated-DNA--[protein]-cysteine S-methyltransferase [Lachnospiraceae bacterium]